MIFIESTLFSRLLPAYLGDEDYRRLQAFLLEQPEAGAMLQGSGGLRKLRWSAKGHGKRGGVRVIYYFYAGRNRFYLLTLYAKNEVSDLSAAERQALRELLQRWKDEQA